MEKKKMVLQLLLLTAVLLLCMANVSSSDSNVKSHDHILTESQVVKGPSRRLLPYVDCGARCRVRCSLHSRPKICHRACGTCCSRCKCVPPGTSGNRHMCGSCYTDMITHRHRLKCP